MHDFQGRSLLLFDGDCGICTELSRWAEAKAAGLDPARFDVLPYFDVPESQLREFGLSYEDCTHSVQLISPEGKVRSGAFAVNHFLLQIPRWRWTVISLYVLFPLIPFEILGYWIVARNRHRISAALGMNACKVRFVDEAGSASPPALKAGDETPGAQRRALGLRRFGFASR